MLPIGTADSKTLHLPSHLPARKGDNLLLSTCPHIQRHTWKIFLQTLLGCLCLVPLWISLRLFSPLTISVSQQPQLILFHKKAHQVSRSAQKRRLPLSTLLITFCRLFSLYSIQVNTQCYSSSSPAVPHQPTQPHQPLQVTALSSCCCRGYIPFGPTH